MAYVTPTPADLKAMHPKFAAVVDQVVADAIAEGEGRVDDTWLERDRRPAVMLYAAHVMTMNGHGSGTEAQLAADGLGEFQSIRSGGLSVTRFERGRDAGTLGSTSYGKRFRELLRLNHGGPRAVPPADCRPIHPAAQDY